MDSGTGHSLSDELGGGCSATYFCMQAQSSAEYIAGVGHLSSLYIAQGQSSQRPQGQSSQRPQGQSSQRLATWKDSAISEGTDPEE